jgi:hypothetical protein
LKEIEFRWGSLVRRVTWLLPTFPKGNISKLAAPAKDNTVKPAKDNTVKLCNANPTVLSIVNSVFCSWDFTFMGGVGGFRITVSCMGQKDVLPPVHHTANLQEIDPSQTVGRVTWFLLTFPKKAQ